MKKLLLSIIALSLGLAVYAQNPYPIMLIDSVQYVNDTKLSNSTANTLPDYIDPIKKNPTYGDTVRFDAIVVTNPSIYGLSINRKAIYVQRKGGGPWSGVQVMCDPAGSGLTLADFKTETQFFNNCVVGYPVRITGVIRDFAGETQVNLIRNNANWSNAVEQLALTPDTIVESTITANQLMSGNPNTGWVQQKSTAEKWEGALVKIPNVTVYSIQNSPPRFFWSVIDDLGNVIDVRDFSAYYRNDNNEDTIPKIDNTFQPPAIGTRLEYIRGLVTEYQVSGISRYGISPIYPNDLKVCTSCPPVIKYINRNPVIVKQSDTATITISVAVGDTTLNNVWLYYKTTQNGTLDSVNLTPVPSFPNYYAAKILPLNMETVFTWWVRATDNKDRSTIFPDPFTVGNSFMIVGSSGVNDIRTLQFSIASNGATIWNGDSLTNVDIRGIITGNTFSSSTQNLLTLQNGNGPNSGIFIQRSPGDPTSTWKVGDSVNITSCKVTETFNTTILNNIRGTVVSSGVTLPRFQRNLPIDSFIQNRVLFARPWEAVMVRFDTSYIISKNPDAPGNNGEFSFNPNSAAGTGLRVDDMSNELRNLNSRLKPGMKMDFIQGAMWFSFGNFKLIPRGLADLDLSRLDTLPPVITLLGKNPDTIPVGTTNYVDSGAIAIDNLDGDITSQIVKSGTVNGMAIGAYTLKYKVTDSWGYSDSTTRLVLVVDTASVGLRKNELDFAEINLYPNPAQNVLQFSTRYIPSGRLSFTLTNLLGEEVFTRQFNTSNLHELLDISMVKDGLYFASIRTASGHRVVKLMIGK